MSEGKRAAVALCWKVQPRWMASLTRWASNVARGRERPSGSARDRRRRPAFRVNLFRGHFKCSLRPVSSVENIGGTPMPQARSMAMAAALMQPPQTFSRGQRERSRRRTAPAALGEEGGGDAAGGARADDDGVPDFIGHVWPSLLCAPTSTECAKAMRARLRTAFMPAFSAMFLSSWTVHAARTLTGPS